MTVIAKDTQEATNAVEIDLPTHLGPELVCKYFTNNGINMVSKVVIANLSELSKRIGSLAEASDEELNELFSGAYEEDILEDGNVLRRAIMYSDIAMDFLSQMAEDMNATEGKSHDAMWESLYEALPAWKDRKIIIKSDWKDNTHSYEDYGPDSPKDSDE